MIKSLVLMRKNKVHNTGLVEPHFNPIRFRKQGKVNGMVLSSIFLIFLIVGLNTSNFK